MNRKSGSGSGSARIHIVEVFWIQIQMELRCGCLSRIRIHIIKPVDPHHTQNCSDLNRDASYFQSHLALSSWFYYVVTFFSPMSYKLINYCMLFCDLYHNVMVGFIIYFTELNSVIYLYIVVYSTCFQKVISMIFFNVPLGICKV